MRITIRDPQRHAKLLRALRERGDTVLVELFGADLRYGLTHFADDYLVEPA